MNPEHVDPGADTTLGRFHFYFGVAVVIAFALTGQYMHHRFDHLREMEPVSRTLFRTGHLYILLFGLINVALGMGARSVTEGWLGRVRALGSAIVVGATLLVVYAFFAELPTTHIERPPTRISLYLILFGVSVAGAAHFVETRRSTRR